MDLKIQKDFKLLVIETNYITNNGDDYMYVVHGPFIDMDKAEQCIKTKATESNETDFLIVEVKVIVKPKQISKTVLERDLL